MSILTVRLLTIGNIMSLNSSFLSMPTGKPTIICEIPSPGFLEFVKERFDGVWLSSLTQSFQQHLPDNQSLPWAHYVEMVSRIRSVDGEVNIVVDVDTLAGDPAVAAMIAQRYAMAGADAIVMEDKNSSAKTNSLFATGSKKIPLVSPDEMCKKLRAVRHAVEGSRTKVVARTEYLPRNMDNPQIVVDIAVRYFHAGAHVIMVHAGKESVNLEPLKFVLQQLRDIGIPTMIVPQGFTPRVAEGEFDTLVGTVILGNVVTSKILELLNNVTSADLLQKPKFGGLLTKSEEITPKSRSMIVLGGKPRPDGQYLLNSEKVRKGFLSAAARNNCSEVIYLIGQSDEHETYRDNDSEKFVYMKDSLGEVDSLKAALLHAGFSDEILVIYADEDLRKFESVNQSSWNGDRFRGSFLVDAASLAQALDLVSPQDFMIDLLSHMNTTRIQVSI